MADLRDEFGNPIHQYQKDEYGNPIHQQHGMGTHGATGYGGAPATGTGGLGGGQQQLHRSGSASSSSEDDGEGGRRKKGLKEKIKEKLPGGHKEKHPTTTAGSTGGYGQGQHYSSTTGTGTGTTGVGGYGQGVQHHPQEKGMMEKIKEKLPGHHNN